MAVNPLDFSLAGIIHNAAQQGHSDLTGANGNKIDPTSDQGHTDLTLDYYDYKIQNPSSDSASQLNDFANYEKSSGVDPSAVDAFVSSLASGQPQDTPSAAPVGPDQVAYQQQMYGGGGTLMPGEDPTSSVYTGG